jgi:hypothetical protein
MRGGRSTRRVLPGGSLRSLSGQRLEVRDETGAGLLMATFPTVE